MPTSPIKSYAEAQSDYVKRRPMKLDPREHVEMEWETVAGYWVNLKPGYRVAGEPLVHCIHKRTKQLCYKQAVAYCNCEDCLLER